MSDGDFFETYDIESGLHLRGGMQCWIAAEALRRSGLNPEFYEYLTEAIEDFRQLGLADHDAAYSYVLVAEPGEEEIVETTRQDILFSLAALACDPDASFEHTIAADALMGELQTT